MITGMEHCPVKLADNLHDTLYETNGSVIRWFKDLTTEITVNGTEKIWWRRPTLQDAVDKWTGGKSWTFHADGSVEARFMNDDGIIRSYYWSGTPNEATILDGQWAFEYVNIDASYEENSGNESDSEEIQDNLAWYYGTWDCRHGDEHED